jgi:hypothetical protein
LVLPLSGAKKPQEDAQAHGMPLPSTTQTNGQPEIDMQSIETSASTARGILRVGLIAPPGPALELARQLAEELPAALREQVSGDVEWAVPVLEADVYAGPGTGGVEMIDLARELMLEEGWDLAISVTDLPLRIRRRPLVADASATHGVGVLSLPALGAVQRRRRARDAVVRLVLGLLGESLDGRPTSTTGQRLRIGRRVAELVAPVRPVVPSDGDVDLRFVAAVVRGNLRLLLGMVRANRPWRLVTHLSRALGAALAAVAFALVTSDIWKIADSLGWVRLLAIALVSLAMIVVALVVAHGLWERAPTGRGREQAVLFNLATTATVAVGVATLYVALFLLSLLGAGLVLDSDVLARALGHPVDFGDYAGLAWFVSSLSTVGGALGAGLESDVAVREAAYGYRPDRAADDAADDAEDGQTISG